MHEPASAAPVGDAIVTALHYLQHFPEALDEGATVCLPTDEVLLTRRVPFFALQPSSGVHPIVPPRERMP
jgi:hypothetical protein